MPTGYTEIIERGCNFEEYVWRCVRGMGACVALRDASLSGPVPETFKPEPYYQTRVVEAEARIKELSELPVEEIVERQVSANAEIRRGNEERRRGHDDLRRKYRTMRDQVIAWGPPTPDHHGLKAFMLEQIDLCLDKGEPYQTPENEIVEPEVWRQTMLADAQRQLARAKDEWNKEQERTAGRNEWLRQLRESVPQPAMRAA